MNGKALAVLAGITLAAVVGAGVTMMLPPAGSAGGAADRTAPLLPRLAEDVNAAAAIEIADGERSLALERSDGVWVVREKSGYPARIEAIRQLLLMLADLEPIEPKTDDPSQYDRIGVVAPSDGGDATLVAVRDDSGADLGALILGDASSVGRFVRVEDQRRSWLIADAVDASPDPMRWIDRTLMRVESRRVRRLSISHPDGEDFTIMRRPEDDGFMLVDPPAGRTPDDQQLRRAQTALSFVTLTDVRALRPDEPPADATVATVETTDGLRVIARVWGQAEAAWSTFEVDATGDDADVATEAAELAARVEGWAYQIAGNPVTVLRLRLDDVAPIAPSGDAGPPTP